MLVCSLALRIGTPGAEKNNDTKTKEQKRAKTNNMKQTRGRVFGEHCAGEVAECSDQYKQQSVP